VSDSSDSAQRGIDAFNQGGSEAFVDYLVAESHPDFIFHIQEDLPNGGVWNGIDGTRAMMGQWLEAWEEFEVIAREFIDGPAGQVLVPVEQRAVASGSGMEVSGEFQYVWVPEGGKVREIHLFADPRQARRAAGLGD
jgi:hypothetical protein